MATAVDPNVFSVCFVLLAESKSNIHIKKYAFPQNYILGVSIKETIINKSKKRVRDQKSS